MGATLRIDLDGHRLRMAPDHVRLTHRVDTPTQVEVRLGQDGSAPALDPQHVVGHPISIFLNENESFRGDVVEVELQGGFSLLRGQSRLARLEAVHDLRTWTGTPIEDIARDLLAPADLDPSLGGGGRSPPRAFAVQPFVSNLNALIGLCREEGLAVLCSGTGVSLGTDRPSVRSLGEEHTLSDLKVRQRTSNVEYTRVIYDPLSDRELERTVRASGGPPRGSGRRPAAYGDPDGIERQARVDAAAAERCRTALEVRIGGVHLRPGDGFDLEPTLTGTWVVEASEFLFRHGYLESLVWAVPAGTSLARAPERPAAQAHITAARVVDDRDPLGLCRVRIRLVHAHGDGAVWARVAQPVHGPHHGVFGLPRIGDEVFVLWEEGRRDAPVVIGSLIHGKELPPLATPNGTRDRWLLRDGATGIRAILEPGSERILVETRRTRVKVEESEAGPRIEVNCPGEVVVRADRLDIQVKSLQVKVEQDVVMEVGGDTQHHLAGALQVGVGGRVRLDGEGIEVQARQDLVLAAAGPTELASAERTDIVGQEVHVTTGAP